MTNIVLDWSPDDLINVGIVFGFFLGFICHVLCHFVDVVLNYLDDRKKQRQDLNRDFGSDKK